MDLRGLFLVGHSMGGAIVQTLAITHPEVIRGIVLVGTGARLKVLPAVLNGIKDKFEETVKKIVRFAFSRKAPRELIEAGIEHLMKCRPRVLYADFLACDRFDLMKEVSKIDLPTLIVCGEEDEMTPVKYSEFLHHHIRSSKLEVLPDAGHMVMMEIPRGLQPEGEGFYSGCPVMKKQWVTIELHIPREFQEAISNFLMEQGATGVEEEEEIPGVRLKAYFPEDGRKGKVLRGLDRYLKSLEKIFPQKIPCRIETALLQEQDWGENWKKYFHPLQIGSRFVVYPPGKGCD